MSLLVPSPRKTFRVSGNLVIAASAAPFLAIIGSASKIVRITRIKIHGPTLTAAQLIRLACNKHSAAHTGGTSTTPTCVPLDSSSGNATAVVRAYTVAPTPGALVGQISERTVIGQSTTLVASAALDEGDFDFTAGEISTEFPTLRGVAETLSIALPVAPASAVTVSYMIEFTEENV